MIQSLHIEQSLGIKMIIAHFVKKMYYLMPIKEKSPKGFLKRKQLSIMQCHFIKIRKT